MEEREIPSYVEICIGPMRALWQLPSVEKVLELSINE
jgi:hypothetical protein